MSRVTPEIAVTLFKISTTVYVNSLHLQTVFSVIRLERHNKKLSNRRGTARCAVSVEILPTATQQCRNYLYGKS